MTRYSLLRLLLILWLPLSLGVLDFVNYIIIPGVSIQSLILVLIYFTSFVFIFETRYLLNKAMLTNFTVFFIVVSYIFNFSVSGFFHGFVYFISYLWVLSIVNNISNGNFLEFVLRYINCKLLNSQNSCSF